MARAKLVNRLFIQVDDEMFGAIATIAESEDRNAPQVVRRLIKEALAARKNSALPREVA